MTQEEIQERNKQIALMLGKKEQLEYWKQWVDIESKLKWHSDWNWLMESVEFIKKNIKTSNDTQDAKIGELFIDEWKFRVKQYYLRIIQWTENGWRMFDGKENSELSMFYIIGENCESEKEAVFLIVSDFAKLYNDKKL